MAYGDTGGPVTDLVLTCRTPATGDVEIHQGDAVQLVDSYTVNTTADPNEPVFGQALNDASDNNALLPVRVRGVCVFSFTGEAPDIDGETGISTSTSPGSVKAPAQGAGNGCVIKTDFAANLVHVLL